MCGWRENKGTTTKLIVVMLKMLVILEEKGEEGGLADCSDLWENSSGACHVPPHKGISSLVGNW